MKTAAPPVSLGPRASMVTPWRLLSAPSLGQQHHRRRQHVGLVTRLARIVLRVDAPAGRRVSQRAVPDRARTGMAATRTTIALTNPTRRSVRRWPDRRRRADSLAAARLREGRVRWADRFRAGPSWAGQRYGLAVEVAVVDAGNHRRASRGSQEDGRRRCATRRSVLDTSSLGVSMRSHVPARWRPAVFGAGSGRDDDRGQPTDLVDALPRRQAGSGVAADHEEQLASRHPPRAARRACRR